MRVYIWKEEDGSREVLFRPAKRARQPMVLLQGVQRRDLKQRVRETLEEMGQTQLQVGLVPL